MTLDAADRKVLLALLDDARAPVSALSKRTRLSREIVAYRREKLENAGIIRAYVARIHQPRFAAGVALLTCRLVRTSEERFREILAFLRGHACVNWVAELCGTADLQLTILYRDAQHLADVIADVTNHLGRNLQSSDVSIYISEYKFDRSGIVSGKATPYKPEATVTFREQERVPLDDIDLGVLRILAEDCRTKNNAIAQSVGISEDVVRLRIRKLERTGVIAGYTIVLDPTRLGYEMYAMGLQLEQMTQETIAKLTYYAHTRPEIVFCARTSGRHNIVMTIDVRDRRHFNEVLQDIKRTFPDELASYEFQLLMREHKEIFVPPAMIR